MWEWIKQFFGHMTTGKDNQTFDVVRVGMLMAIVVLLTLGVYKAVQGIVEFSLKELAEAITYVLGGGGAALWAKKDTEPDK